MAKLAMLVQDLLAQKRMALLRVLWRSLSFLKVR
jgi:hypothetical protein